MKKVKDIILKEGFRSVEADGIKSFTVENLASKLAMSKKTIYQYFPKKEVLIKKIIDKGHQRGCVVLIDGAQSIAHQQIDVEELGCDFFAFCFASKSVALAEAKLGFTFRSVAGTRLPGLRTTVEMEGRMRHGKTASTRSDTVAFHRSGISRLRCSTPTTRGPEGIDLTRKNP